MSDGGWTLREEDLRPLAIGAALLGTGGGGNPYVGLLRCRELLRKGASVRILPLDALPDDALVGEVGGIGAPVVGIEKIEEGGECYRALRAVEDVVGARVSATISAEIGGANAMEPIIAAAMAGLPVIDGDGMGRAFPEVQMTTFFIYGAKAAPAAIADDKGNVVVFKEMVDMFWLERFARDVSVAMGAAAGLAIAPMRMDFIRRTAIPGTVTQALRIGQTVLDARARRQSVIDRLVRDIGAKVFFTGKIIDIRRELLGGFARGHAYIAGSGDWQGATGRIAIQNENLVLWVDDVPIIMVPDLIMNLDLETGEPLTTEVLRYGQRVAVIGLPVHPLLKTPEALKVVGPAAFGYPELTYVPLEG
ncbi:MAG: hypothetical protein RL216_1217 [Pseudomonadota bacterium]|jgi:DUF917 family protein